MFVISLYRYYAYNNLFNISVNISYAKSTLLNILLLFIAHAFAYTHNGKQKRVITDMRYHRNNNDAQ